MISVVRQWPERAACLDYDPELFFPEKDGSAQAELAKEVCATCPARMTCLTTAIEADERHGVWGGVVLAGKRLGKKDRDRATALLAKERDSAET